MKATPDEAPVTMYSRMLIAVGGSDEARHAAARGLRLAADFDASVTVLYVVEQKALTLTETTSERSRLRERGEAALAEIGDLAADRDQQLTTTIAEGKPSVQISEHAAEEDADLIVVGRQGLTGVGRRILGGVTENVLHRSDVPVYVVPGEATDAGDDDELSRLLIPTDGSENAKSATPHGIAIAERFESTVHVLNVVDLQSAGGMFDAGGLERSFVQRLESRGQQAVDRIAKEIEETASDVPVETAVETTTSFEGAAAGLRDYVEEHDIDLAVMGSHGRSNLQRQLLGSVASTVIRTVDVPVLVVKRDGADADA